jgi:hypothetical protein
LKGGEGVKPYLDDGKITLWQGDCIKENIIFFLTFGLCVVKYLHKA